MLPSALYLVSTTRTTCSATPPSTGSDSHLGDIGHVVQDFGVLWTTETPSQVLLVVSHNARHAPRGHCGPRPPRGRSNARVAGQLRYSTATRSNPSGGGLHSCTADSTQVASTFQSAANRRAFARPTGEKSTPVTSQPCSASHTALRPSPQARSTARPGGRPTTSETRNWFGVFVQTKSSPL